MQPLLGGEDVPWRSEFFCEHLGFQNWIPPFEGIRSNRYKYARYINREPVYEFLHDLKKDPDQLVNFAGNPEYVAVLKQFRQQTESEIQKHTRPATVAKQQESLKAD